MNVTIDDYLNKIGSISRLTKEEEKELLTRIATGDTKAKEALISANLRLVVDIASKYTQRGLPLMDLIQEGNIGLMYCVDKFNLSFNCRFSTYATGWIKCFILRSLSQTSHLIRLPHRVVDEIKLYRKTWDKLTAYSHKEPTEQEIADEMNIKLKKLKRIKGAMLNEIMLSFDTPVGTEENTTLSDLIASEDFTQEDYAHNSLLSIGLKKAVDLLPTKERIAIIYKYGLFGAEVKTNDELAAMLHLSQEGARKATKRGLKMLQAEKRLKKLQGLRE